WNAQTPDRRIRRHLVHARGGVEYVCPGFEHSKVTQSLGVPGDVLTWEEEESPYRLIASRLPPGTLVGLDDQVAFFVYLGLARALSTERIADAGPLIGKLRSRKSAAEIALMARAKAITLEVQRRAWKSLAAGVMTS